MLFFQALKTLYDEILYPTLHIILITLFFFFSNHIIIILQYEFHKHTKRSLMRFCCSYLINMAYMLWCIPPSLNRFSTFSPYLQKLAMKCIRELKQRKKDEKIEFICKICKEGKKFTAGATLIYHYRSHAGK